MIPTEPIGSIPRPPELVEGIQAAAVGCGFSPFADDTSTARATAFAKIRARVEGTRLASEQLGRGAPRQSLRAYSRYSSLIAGSVP